LVQTSSVSKAMDAAGFGDYVRKSTKITADNATLIQAGLLECSRGDALVKTVSINVSKDDVPVEYGVTWFVGSRVSLDVDFSA